MGDPVEGGGWLVFLQAKLTRVPSKGRPAQLLAFSVPGQPCCHRLLSSPVVIAWPAMGQSRPSVCQCCTATGIGSAKHVATGFEGVGRGRGRGRGGERRGQITSGGGEVGLSQIRELPKTTRFTLAPVSNGPRQWQVSSKTPPPHVWHARCDSGSFVGPLAFTLECLSAVDLFAQRPTL